MDSKRFLCLIHPKEPIQRISFTPQTSNYLYCIECIMDTTKETRESLVPLDDFSDKIQKEIKSSNKTYRFNTKAPESLASLIEKEDESIIKLSEHIEQQRIKVEASFEIIQAKMLETLEKEKQRVLAELDQQLENLKSTFADYKSKLDQFFSEDEYQHDYQEEMDIKSLIEDCNESNELNKVVKNLIEKIQETKKFSSQIKDEHTLLSMLKNWKDAICEALKQSPNYPDIGQEYESHLKKASESSVQLMVSNTFSLQQSIPRLGLFENSSSTLKPEDLDLVKKTFFSSLDFTLKSVYCASKVTDGFLATSYVKKLLSLDTAFVLITTQDKRRFVYITHGKSSYALHLGNKNTISDESFSLIVDEIGVESIYSGSSKTELTMAISLDFNCKTGSNILDFETDITSFTVSELEIFEFTGQFKYSNPSKPIKFSVSKASKAKVADSLSSGSYESIE